MAGSTTYTTCAMLCNVRKDFLRLGKINYICNFVKQYKLTRSLDVLGAPTPSRRLYWQSWYPFQWHWSLHTLVDFLRVGCRAPKVILPWIVIESKLIILIAVILHRQRIDHILAPELAHSWTQGSPYLSRERTLSGQQRYFPIMKWCAGLSRNWQDCIEEEGTWCVCLSDCNIPTNRPQNSFASFPSFWRVSHFCFAASTTPPRWASSHHLRL